MEQYEFIGHMAADAEVIQGSGKPFIAFRVAVSRKFKNQQGDTVERTKWIDCTRNGDERFAKYLTKGRQVFVRGDVEARAYFDKEGKPRATLACHAQDVQLLGGGTQKQEQQQQTPQQQTPKNDLPF